MLLFNTGYVIEMLLDKQKPHPVFKWSMSHSFVGKGARQDFYYTSDTCLLILQYELFHELKCLLIKTSQEDKRVEPSVSLSANRQTKMATDRQRPH